MFSNKEHFDLALQAFQTSMKEFVNEIKKSEKIELPIFIFIDDLDCCRPDFTLEVFEAVKHILSMNDVYFVFATDTEQLKHSLTAVYGRDYDSEKYLKRIFNRECKLKTPDFYQFARFLFSEKGGFNGGNLDTGKLLSISDASISDKLSYWFSLLSSCYDLAPRTQIACRDLIDDVLNIRRETLYAIVAVNTLSDFMEYQHGEESSGFEVRSLLALECGRAFVDIGIPEVLKFYYQNIDKSCNDIISTQNNPC